MKATVNVTGVGNVFVSIESHSVNPDLVRVRVSQAVDRHYVRRQAFPQLRVDQRAAYSDAYNLFWCSQSDAIKILDDAKAEVKFAVGHEKNALNAHIQHLEVEIDEARLRRKWLEGAEPKIKPSYSCATYFATHSQLGSLGVPVGLALPGSPGGPARKANFVNSVGRKCSIYRADSFWPGTFRVEIEKVKERSAKKADETLVKLEAAPKNVIEFQTKRAESLDFAVSALRVPLRLTDPGYDYAKDTKAAYLNEVEAAIARLRAILLQGTVVGEGPAAQIAARRADLAKQDMKLQGFLRIVHSSTGRAS